MRKQLWFRLLVGTSVMLVLALGTAGILLHQFAVSSFEDYVEDVNAVRGQRVEALLSRYYSRRHSWTGVEPLVQQIADLVGQPVLLADSDDVVIVDSQHRFEGQRVSERWRQEIVPIRSGDVAVGTLYVDPLIPRERFGERGDAFLAELTRSLLSALGVGLLAALAVSLLLARRLARPLEMLTAAARRLEAGERPTELRTSMGGEVGQLAEAFNSLAASLTRVEQLRQNMVNDIAHELRTPLTTVQGYIEALQDGITEATPEVLNTVHTELLQLTRLVDDLRDLALAEARQLSLTPEPVDVDELIAHNVRASTVAAELQRVRIETEIDPRLPQLRLDRVRISQVVRNILNNAQAHTPAGGVIRVRAYRDKDAVAIDIQDSGSGIAAEDLPHVFERFYRGDRSRSRRAGGAGLGLTIARELVAAHGGKLIAESQPGAGARFTIRLPIEPPRVETESQKPSMAPRPELGPRDVLRACFA
jgi:signal transduction histidine kinase